MLKRACRHHGIPKWQGRSIRKCLKKGTAKAEKQRSREPGAAATCAQQQIQAQHAESESHLDVLLQQNHEQAHQLLPDDNPQMGDVDDYQNNLNLQVWQCSDDSDDDSFWLADGVGLH